MKYALVAAALASTAVAQSNTVAASVIASVIASTNNLDSAINSYSGGDGAQLKSDSASLVSLINNGATQVTNAGALSSNDAINLVSPVQSLVAAVKQATSDIVSKKSVAVANGQGAAVYSALVAQQSASNVLTSAIEKEVPQGLSGTAQGLAAPIAADLSSAVAAYADATGAVSSSSAASTGSSSAASSMATSASASSSAVVVSSASGAASSTGSPTTSSSSSTGSPIHTGAASNVQVTGAVAGLAFLAVLGL